MPNRNAIKIDVLEPLNFSAVRPTARSVAEYYLAQFHPGARALGDPVALEVAPAPGLTRRFEFTTASGVAGTIYLGEATGGGWQVRARVLGRRASSAAG